MKAIVISKHGGPEVLELREVPDPEPSAEDVLVRVRATALNRADLLQRRGLYPAPPGVAPDIPGLEFAGEVVAIGPRVYTWKPGDRVMGLLAGGGYAEKVAIHERLLLPVPPRLDWRSAAAIPEVFLTAFDSVFLQAGLRMGETLLVNAVASGVGTAAVQLARRAGARSIGTSRSAGKLAAVLELGLDVGIVAGSEDFEKQVKEQTAGRGVDVVLDLIGASAWADNMRAIGERGRIVLVGMMGGAKVEANLGVLLQKRVTVMGTVLRARPLEEKAALVQAFRRQVLPGFTDGSLVPVVDCAFPIAQAAEAHQLMEENRNTGKIILELD